LPFEPIIRLKPGPQSIRVDADDGIRLSQRSAAAHLDGNRVRLDCVLLSRQCLLDDESQKGAKPVGSRERRAALDALDVLTYERRWGMSVIEVISRL